MFNLSDAALAALRLASTSLIDVLAPRRCAACRTPLAKGADVLLCPNCQVTPAPPPPQRLGSIPVVAPFYYEGAIKTAIQELKYRKRPQIADALATKMAGGVARLASHGCLVPVPIHPSRLQERGYNQAGLLVTALTHLLNRQTQTDFTCSRRCLYRRHNVVRQAELNRAQRLRNLSQVIGVRKIPNTDVILVDDVFTTGATAQACVEALQQQSIAVKLIVTAAIANRLEYRLPNQAGRLPA